MILLDKLRKSSPVYMYSESTSSLQGIYFQAKLHANCLCILYQFYINCLPTGKYQLTKLLKKYVMDKSLDDLPYA